jgi:hypothetical protein
MVKSNASWRSTLGFYRISSGEANGMHPSSRIFLAKSFNFVDRPEFILPRPHAKALFAWNAVEKDNSIMLT